MADSESIRPSASEVMSAQRRALFWSRVDKSAGEDGCWLWLGGRDKFYGVFRVDYGRGLIRDGAHRVAYELLRGRIPNGLHIDHLCRNQCCVNPKHLEPVSSRVNVLRGVGVAAKNSRKEFCDNGHSFTSDNTRVEWRRDGRRERICLACKSLRRRRYRATHGK